MILGDSKRRALIGFGVMGMVIINSALGVTARRGKVVKKSGEVSDENGIILENDYIRAAMVTNDLGGQVMSLIYKPTGQELAPARHHMGYCLDRMGEGRYYFKRAGKDHRGEILSQSDEKAETKYSYIWKYNRHDLKTEVLCTKIYTLRKDAAYLEVVWTFKNIGKQKAIMTPWIKHVGGHDDVLLNGGRVLLNEGGAYDPGGAFVNAVTNWNIRQSKVGNSEEYPMACSCTDFAPLFQQFDWTGKERYTLETIMSRITLEPGKSWQLPYTISFMPNLAKPVFGAPELAASFETKEEPAPGKSCNVTVHVSGAHNFGEVRLEGDVRKLEGETVEKLPNRQIVIAPGKISTAEYTFTPPANGVYNLNLSVFIGQQPYKLGDFVEAQQTMMVLPVVVGPKPAKVVKKWQSGGFSWPRRKPKDIIPWRSLVKNERVQVGQLKVLDRFYPEYSLTCKDGTEPARIRLAKGEYEDVQFVVQFANPEDVLKQEIEVSPLSHRSGAKISKVQLKEAIYLTTEVPSNYLNFPIGQYPDPLMNYGWEKKIPDAEVTKKNLDVFKKSGKRSFWLVLKSPSDAPDGIFAGKITIRTEGKVVGEFPLEVEVEPFALPRRASYRCSTGMVGWKNVDRQLEVLKMPKEEIKRVLDNTNGMDSYRRLVIEYGWTPVMWFGFAQLQKYYDYG
ncbi:MAG: hypothetical protein QF473_33280, partial [Planctomycetota bacterium]|nr:hypothetical protein [Planctomycetota bacterium]